MKDVGGWPVTVRMAGGRRRGGAIRRREGSLPAGLTVLALAAIGLVALVVLFALQ